MPELPEVETVKRGLEPAMKSQIIREIQVNRPDLRWPFPENMAERIRGYKVENLRRRSKYILIDLSSAETLIVHLGMSGRMLIDDAQTAEFHNANQPRGKHDHVVFHLSGGKVVTFNDARRFGAMDLYPTSDLENHWLIKPIGPEPLGNAFDAIYLAEQLKPKTSPIKNVLLDQRVVAGLGNIYVCEVLHRTGISPKRKAKTLSKPRVSSLVPAIRDVLSEAIEAGGSSLKDHRQTNGELGYFQHNFAVYDREGENCLKPDCSGTIKRIVQSGRSSFYCNRCQR